MPKVKPHKSSLYALLVGINDYPSAPLKGCVNDMRSVRDYLDDYCRKNKLFFKPLVLEDAQASREQIMAAFDHFLVAAPTDICLFFFAGHGSHYPVPDEFRHLEPDQELETIVCHDSRSEGGRDLVDKELSYRIWEVSQKRKTPFISVMDCCHSGAFRTIIDKNGEVAVREMRSGKQSIPPTDLYQFKHYEKDTGGRVTPPMSRRIHLGAARDMETAKEVRINGQRRGIFTYSLLEILEQTTGAIPYDELIKRINHIVRKAVSDQSSQLMVSQTEDKRLLFLNTKPAPDKHLFLVSHDPKYGWSVDAGAIYGIPNGDENQKTTFRLINDDHRIEVNKVLPHLSLVQSMEGYNKNTTHPATLERLAEPRFRLAFAEGIQPEDLAILKKAIAENPSDLFRVSPEGAEADFLILADDRGFSLFRLEENKRIGRPVPGLSEESATLFINEVESILKWYQVLLMANPATTITDEEVSITLNRVTDAGNYDDNTEIESEDWQEPTLFEYIRARNQWHQPAFQLKIKNMGHRQLTVSLLYLSENFTITNQLIQAQILEPGQEVWALDHADGRSYLTIPLQLEDHYLQAGIGTIAEYLKVFVCTEPFDTDRFNQKGVPWRAPSSVDVTRSLAARGQIERPDWQYFEIPILIRRPKNAL